MKIKSKVLLPPRSLSGMSLKSRVAIGDFVHFAKSLITTLCLYVRGLPYNLTEWRVDLRLVGAINSPVDLYPEHPQEPSSLPSGSQYSANNNPGQASGRREC